MIFMMTHEERVKVIQNLSLTASYWLGQIDLLESSIALDLLMANQQKPKYMDRLESDYKRLDDLKQQYCKEMGWN